MTKVEHIYNAKVSKGNKDVVVIEKDNLMLKIFNDKVWVVKYNDFTEFVPIFKNLFNLGLDVSNIVSGNSHFESLKLGIENYKKSNSLLYNTIDEINNNYRNLKAITNALNLVKPKSSGNVSGLGVGVSLTESNPTLKSLSIDGRLVEMTNSGELVGVFYVNTKGDYYKIK